MAVVGNGCQIKVGHLSTSRRRESSILNAARGLPLQTLPLTKTHRGQGKVIRVERNEPCSFCLGSGSQHVYHFPVGHVIVSLWSLSSRCIVISRDVAVIVVVSLSSCCHGMLLS